MPLVSVLIAVYNGELYIKNTIQSILNQTYTNFELIIVVNCSNDSTKEILKEFNDERIKIYETNICQLAFNLNYGLLHSKGDYIVRIDADDIAESTRVEKQLQIMMNDDYDIVGSNLTYIDEDGQIKGERKYPKHNEDIRKKILYASPIAHPSVMYKKSVVLKVAGYMNGKVSEDYDLWLRLMRLAFNEVASYMIREALYQKSFRYFIGFCVYIVKSIFN